MLQADSVSISAATVLPHPTHLLGSAGDLGCYLGWAIEISLYRYPLTLHLMHLVGLYSMDQRLDQVIRRLDRSHC